MAISKQKLLLNKKNASFETRITILKHENHGFKTKNYIFK